MLEIGLAESKDSSHESALEDNWVNPIKEVSHLLCNLIQGERGGISLASPNEEAIEVDHLLVEPHATGSLDDDAMYLSSINLENCLTVGGTPCSTGYYDQGDDYGILNADAEQIGRQALKYEFMLQGPEENENLHITCNLSCDCSDYLLEAISAENSLDYPSNSATTIRNLEYASQIQCIERGFDEVKPDFAYFAKTVAIATLDHTTVARDSTKVLSHDALHSTFCRNASFEAQKCLKHDLLFEQQNLIELGNAYDLMEGACLSSENEDDMILIPGNEMPERVFSSLVSMPHTGALVSVAAENKLLYGDGQVALSQGTHETSGTTNDSVMSTKRLRKPTRRYIEETSEIKPRCSYDRLKMSLNSSKEKLHLARTEGKYPWSGAVQLLYQDYPGRVQSLRSRRRKSTKQLGNDRKGYILPPSESAKNSCFQDSELQDDASDESPTRILKRRKHHRQWTLSEVVKLVDGVSQYGVGRWTEIKRLLFSTSAYRTAVDLKDKWRNLLRASVADPANNNLVEPQKRHASAPIPQSILQRVRELSIIHPYPRSQKSRITYLPIASPTSRSIDAAFVNRRDRIVRRRSFS